MSIADALGISNEQLLEIVEEKRIEGNSGKRSLRNEQETVSGSIEDSKESCENGNLRSRKTGDCGNEE